MKIAFYGSSLLSSYWNGAATYYRGILRELAGRGHDIRFYEPDAFDRQQHRDIDPPDWARVTVYPATVQGLASVMDEAADADVVVKASGVGVFDDELIAGVMQRAHPDARRAGADDYHVNLLGIRISGKLLGSRPLILVFSDPAVGVVVGGTRRRLRLRRRRPRAGVALGGLSRSLLGSH